ncbi:hypothetical protein Aperf_G00000121965 [Anoplocephala perfoliata]
MLPNLKFILWVQDSQMLITDLQTQDSPKEETDDSEGTEQVRILTRSYIRRCRSRYKAVYRRQMETMLRRTAWFLESTPTPSIRIPTAPQLVITSSGVTCAPTSTQSLLEIGIHLDLETQLAKERERQLKDEPDQQLEVLGVPFYLSPHPRASLTSIRSAPTCQASPITPLQADSGEEEECSKSISRPQ